MEHEACSSGHTTPYATLVANCTRTACTMHMILTQRKGTHKQANEASTGHSQYVQPLPIANRSQYICRLSGSPEAYARSRKRAPAQGQSVGTHVDMIFLQDILLLRVVCARINRLFIPPAHPHCPQHCCNTIAQLLGDIRPPPPRPPLCMPYTIQYWQ